MKPVSVRFTKGELTLPPPSATLVAVNAILSAVVAELPKKRRARIIEHLQENGAALAIGRIRTSPEVITSQMRNEASGFVYALADSFAADLIRDQGAD